MPRKKTSRKKVVEEPVELEPKIEEVSSSPRSPKKFFILGAVVLLIIAVALFLRFYFIVAVVNGRPITRLALDRDLEKKYGVQFLDNLITEKIISQEASKLKINITKEDINKELDAVKQTLPQGTDLNAALKSQNMTMDDFTKQVVIKLQAEKILNPKISITDAEIEEFASKSAAYLTSTDSAKQKEEAKTLLQQQKLGEAFNTWLQELQSKAQILKFPF